MDAKQTAVAFKEFLNKKYGIALTSKERQEFEAVYYQARNDLGRLVAAGLKAARRDTSDHWKTWNQVFEGTFGSIEQPKVNAQFLAELTSELVATINSEDPIHHMMQLNYEDLKIRNLQSTFQASKRNDPGASFSLEESLIDIVPVPQTQTSQVTAEDLAASLIAA
ncbi:hypothetical protein C7H19_23360 [Aphanothece hegewaldii CCALA 016]|uniref:Uncharacterized protein n=1 Tax=Aphanothece hegewaldii CCALA 016 TaxID=2107694 RepID=A0A2T1LR84_9CHRO|nr:hypothetical protein [Aphanothece hegewaldii]PSF31066.1 hypothetical protein C7H19_23360 [Aphanothece hegewaldii CCALA 016]